MKKIVRILCVGLVLSLVLCVGCKRSTDKTDDTSPQQSESSNGNAIELPDVKL